MPAKKTRSILPICLTLIAFTLAASQTAKAQITASNRTANGVTLTWNPQRNSWTLRLIVTEQGSDTQVGIPQILRGNTTSFTISKSLSPNREYNCRLERVRQRGNGVFDLVPPFIIRGTIGQFAGPGAGGEDEHEPGIGGSGSDVSGVGGGFGYGGGGFGGDPFAQRMHGLANVMSSEAKIIEAQGEYLKDRAEARVTIAKAVDKELDNWKKKVVVYFDRREENLRGRMRVRDLYDMKQDQTLRLKDTAARRRYEYITRHGGNTGGTATNLNFVLDLFVGTPISYGIPISELFAENPRHNRWQLTPDMLRHLRVRTQSDSGRHLEFRLDQPAPITMDWPTFFQGARFTPLRDRIGELNEQLSITTEPDEQIAIIHQLEDGFAFLSRGFFRAHGSSPERASLDSRSYQQLIRAEEFLHQKLNEVQLMADNPESMISMSQSFVPEVHGKDAGTLVAWMNSRGMTFAKPKTGGKPAYQRAYQMMHELYALSGAPIMETPKTDLAIETPPPVDDDEEVGQEEPDAEQPE